MKPYFRIIQDDLSENTLFIHSAHINHQYDYVSFGMQKIPMRIHATKEIKMNEIYLSQDIISLLGIPLFCDLEIICKENTIHLGPFIGILTPRIKNIQRFRKDLNRYIFHYNKLGGVIASFALEDIDSITNNISNGYIYNPRIKDWELKTNIPLPSTIFNKCRVNNNPNWKFLGITYKEKIFNFPTFHKWEMYEWLKKEPLLRDALPLTTLCNHPRDVIRFIQKYKKAYLKPIRGTFAKGIIEITATQDSVDLRYQIRKQTISVNLENLEFVHFLKQIFQKSKFLIQEAIDLLTIDDKVVDFRYIYLKNDVGDWVEVGLFARYGKQGSAVSNLTAGGTSKMGEQALQELLPKDTASDLYEQMKVLSYLASTCLEKHLIQCGNLGFDFAIDRDHKLWIIEINNEDPDHRIALVSKRKDLLYFARLQNLLYAKWLAGFNQ